jgi:hypothetical protein
MIFLTKSCAVTFTQIHTVPSAVKSPPQPRSLLTTFGISATMNELLLHESERRLRWNGMSWVIMCMRNSFQISELLWSANCELRIENEDQAIPKLNVHARAAFVYLDVVHEHFPAPSSLPTFPEAVEDRKDDHIPTEVDNFIWYRHCSIVGSYDPAPSFQKISGNHSWSNHSWPFPTGTVNRL